MPDETPMTPKGLREKARQIREMAEARILEIREAAEQEARECERAAAVIERYERGDSSPLTSTRVDTTLGIDTMEARTRSDASKFATGAQNAGRGRLATPFGRWLAEQKMAASVWAESHKDDAGRLRWSPMAVRAWMLPKNAVGARACPEDAAKLIAKETKGAVPATDASWPSGISRPRRRPS